MGWSYPGLAMYLLTELAIIYLFDSLRAFLYAAAGHSHGLIIDHFCGGFEAVQSSVQDLFNDHLENRVDFYEAEEARENGDWSSGEGFTDKEEQDTQVPDNDIFALH